MTPADVMAILRYAGGAVDVLQDFTGDHDHAPMRWSLNDPRRQTLWGSPAPRSWFEQGSPFSDQAVREPQFIADVTVAD